MALHSTAHHRQLQTDARSRRPSASVRSVVDARLPDDRHQQPHRQQALENPQAVASGVGCSHQTTASVGQPSARAQREAHRTTPGRAARRQSIAAESWRKPGGPGMRHFHRCRAESPPIPPDARSPPAKQPSSRMSNSSDHQPSDHGRSSARAGQAGNSHHRAAARPGSRNPQAKHRPTTQAGPKRVIQRQPGWVPAQGDQRHRGPRQGQSNTWRWPAPG